MEARITDNIYIIISGKRDSACNCCINCQCCTIINSTVAVASTNSICYICTCNLNTLALISSEICIERSNRNRRQRNLSCGSCCTCLRLHSRNLELTLIIGSNNLIITIQAVTCAITMTCEVNQCATGCILNERVVAIYIGNNGIGERQDICASLCGLQCSQVSGCWNNHSRFSFNVIS